MSTLDANASLSENLIAGHLDMHTRFPVVERLVFEAPDGVDHSGYWTRPRFRDRLLGWLA